MAKVVNLNRARKAAEKAAAKTAAQRNRVRHGRTKSEKARDRAERDAAAARHEGHRIVIVAGEDEPDGGTGREPITHAASDTADTSTRATPGSGADDEADSTS